MGRKSVLIIDFLGAPQILIAVIRSLASSRGLTLHLMSDNPREPARLSRHLSSFEHVPPGLRDSEMLDRVSESVRAKRIDVLLPSDEESVRFLSSCRAALEAQCAVSPVPAPESFAGWRDKWLLAEGLRKHGVPSPRTVLLSEPVEDAGVLTDLRFPALLKDRRGAGGVGIRMVRRLGDLAETLRDHPAPPASRILQEFVPGYDIDCSVLCDRGRVLAWTVQQGILASSRPYAAPAGIRFCNNPGPLATATAWAACSEWSGVAHLDMRYDERTGEYPIVEVNPRYWRSLLGSLVAGVNFPLCACRTALGESYPPPLQREEKFIHENRTSLRQLAAVIRGASKDRFSWRQMNLSFAIRDPLPDLVLLFRR